MGDVLSGSVRCPFDDGASFPASRGEVAYGTYGITDYARAHCASACSDDRASNIVIRSQATHTSGEPVNSDTQAPSAPIKRFLAIFLIVWAIVFAYLGFTRSGASLVIFLLAGVVCLIGGLFCARSFAFMQKTEF
jgi:hypothetical protein